MDLVKFGWIFGSILGEFDRFLRLYVSTVCKDVHIIGIV